MESEDKHVHQGVVDKALARMLYKKSAEHEEHEKKETKKYEKKEHKEKKEAKED